MTDWQIEPLRPDHIRSSFSSDQPTLDHFIRELVGQYDKRNLGKTFVATVPGEPLVKGYYTIAASSVPFESLPAELSRKLPHHKVPVLLIARLAVEKASQGRQLGAKLLRDSLRQAVKLSTDLGIHAVLVEAIDSNAASFYRKYGFAPLQDQPRHLFLPLSKITKRESRV